MRKTPRIIKLLFVCMILSVALIVIPAGAYIPVTYSCCKEYMNNGTSLDDFENLGNWELNGRGESYIVADTTNYKEGRQGLKFVAKNDKVYATRTINTDFSKSKNFVFDIYGDNASFGYITLYFTSQKDWSRYFSYTITNINNGWNHFFIKRSDFQNIEGDDWNNTMISFRIAVYPTNGGSTEVTIDNFRYDIFGRAKVIFNFDDGSIGDLEAEKILSANNQKAISFVVTSWVGSKDFMSINDLKMLQAAGWDISSHSASHQDLATIDQNSVITELNDSYDWLVNNRFQKTASFIAYPFGDFNNNVVEMAKRRYVLGRSVSNDAIQLQPSPMNNPYRINAIQVTNNTTVRFLKDEINSTIEDGMLFMMLFHGVANNPTTYQYSKSDFQQISDFINSRSQDIDVVTLSDYVIPNINKFTPIINKTVTIYSNGNVELLTDNKYDEYMSNMTVKPSSDSISINMKIYNEKGLLSFDESGPNTSIDVPYSIGDRIPMQYYSIKTYLNNGTMYYSNIMADDKGYLNYMSKGFDNPRRTDIDISYKKERIISSLITDVIPSTESQTDNNSTISGTDNNSTISSTGNNNTLSSTGNNNTISSTGDNDIISSINSSERNVRKYIEDGILNNDKVNKFLTMFVGLPLYSLIILGIIVYFARSRRR